MLYRTLNIVDCKKQLLLEYTKGRVDSTANLTFIEAKNLIWKLSRYDPADRLRKVIWHLAYKADMIYGETVEDLKMNAAKINAFLASRGVVKKELNKMNIEELKKVHKQFEGLLRNIKRTSDNKEAKSKTDALLVELNLSTLK